MSIRQSHKHAANGCYSAKSFSNASHAQPKMADLIAAAKNGDVHSLRRLHLATGSVNINFRCPPDGTTPLYWAACNGHVTACDWLIHHSADVNLATEKSGSTPLHGAADRGHTDCVRFLLKRGSDVRLVTKSNGDTPLHLAAYRGHADICRLLLEHGACADVLNQQGRTPMQEAQIKSHYDIYRLIFKYHTESWRDRERSLRSLRSSTYELDSAQKHFPLPSDEMKTISEPIFSSSSSGGNFNDILCRTDDDKDLLSRRHHRHHYHLSGVSSWLDESVQSSDRLPLTPASTGHQSSLISTNSVVRKLPIVAPEVAPRTDDGVARREEVISGLVRRISALTSYILSLEVRLAVKDSRLAELTRENEVLTRTYRQYKQAVQELKEERCLNLELQQRMREAEGKKERLIRQGTRLEGGRAGQAFTGNT